MEIARNNSDLNKVSAIIDAYSFTFFFFLFFFLAGAANAQIDVDEIQTIELIGDELAVAPALKFEEKIGEVVLKVELPKATYLPGEVIWVNFSVIHTGQTRTVVMSPPWHGNYVSTVDVIVRTEKQRAEPKDNGQGEQLWNPPKAVIGHGKLYMGQEYFDCHDVIEIGPGQKFIAWIPINVLQGNNVLSQFGHGMESNWIPGFGFPKPGKYQFFVRYWDSSLLWTGASLDNYLTPETAVKEKARRRERGMAMKKETGGFMRLKSATRFQDQPYHTFGPFEIELIPPSNLELRAKDQVAALEKMLARWQTAQGIREPFIDYIHGFRESDIKELPDVLQGKMLDSVLADALSFTLIRHHLSIEREEGKPAKFVPLKLEDIDSLLERMMNDDPLWTHVVLAKCIWLHEHDKREEALKLADSIRATNPDAEVFWHLAQYGKWTEPDREHPQQPK